MKTYTKAEIGKSERHNERKNTDYGNVNVVPERIPMNVHFKSPGEKSYIDILKEKEKNGELSERGLKADAVIFDEVIFDVNTMYFEENGGYEYAKEFYEEAYQFACKKYGEENIVSAVMHADEINKAASDELGRDIYHYHMHLVAFPVVDKEVLWSKRCKEENLRGTVKEVVHQISHSKKWESKDQVVDENGQPVFRKNGKPKFRASYSILQDEFYTHMVEHGFEGFQRGDRGSTREHLSSLQYQIEKDTERLEKIDSEIRSTEDLYESARDVNMTYREIETAGKKNALTGNYSVPKDDYEQLVSLAKEGITSRSKIGRLNQELSDTSDRYYRLRYSYENLKNKFDELMEKCEPFLQALEYFPDMVKKFAEKVSDLIRQKDLSKQNIKKQTNKER